MTLSSFGMTKKIEGKRHVIAIKKKKLVNYFPDVLMVLTADTTESISLV